MAILARDSYCAPLKCCKVCLYVKDGEIVNSRVIPLSRVRRKRKSDNADGLPVETAQPSKPTAAEVHALTGGRLACRDGRTTQDAPQATDGTGARGAQAATDRRADGTDAPQAAQGGNPAAQGKGARLPVKIGSAESGRLTGDFEKDKPALRELLGVIEKRKQRTRERKKALRRRKAIEKKIAQAQTVRQEIKL